MCRLKPQGATGRSGTTHTKIVLESFSLRINRNRTDFTDISGGFCLFVSSQHSHLQDSHRMVLLLEEISSEQQLFGGRKSLADVRGQNGWKARP